MLKYDSLSKLKNIGKWNGHVLGNSSLLLIINIIITI